jgi:hypothetical protein
VSDNLEEEKRAALQAYLDAPKLTASSVGPVNCFKAMRGGASPGHPAPAIFWVFTKDEFEKMNLGGAIQVQKQPRKGDESH